MPPGRVNISSEVRAKPNTVPLPSPFMKMAHCVFGVISFTISPCRKQKNFISVFICQMECLEILCPQDMGWYLRPKLKSAI